MSRAFWLEGAEFRLPPPEPNRQGRVLAFGCGPLHPYRFRFTPNLSFGSPLGQAGQRGLPTNDIRGLMKP